MANTITGGTSVAPVSSVALATLVSRWRDYLDDAVEPYLWSNEELTRYANRVVNLLCREIGLLEDLTTSAVCSVAVVNGTATYALDQRVLSIQKARLTTYDRNLVVVSRTWLDENVSGWETADAGTPDYLVYPGLGTATFGLYPKPDADDTLTLTVMRMPVSDYTYANDSSSPFELPQRYIDLLDNGVYWLAYGKQDTDTQDLKKSTYHLELFKQEKELIKRARLAREGQRLSAAPHEGWV